VRKHFTSLTPAEASAMRNHSNDNINVKGRKIAGQSFVLISVVQWGFIEKMGIEWALERHQQGHGYGPSVISLCAVPATAIILSLLSLFLIRNEKPSKAAFLLPLSLALSAIGSMSLISLTASI
jgi:hypothetical protein